MEDGQTAEAKSEQILFIGGEADGLRLSLQYPLQHIYQLPRLPGRSDFHKVAEEVDATQPIKDHEIYGLERLKVHELDLESGKERMFLYYRWIGMTRSEAIERLFYRYPRP